MIIKILPFIIFISSMWFMMKVRNNKDLLTLKVFGYSNLKIFFILALVSFLLGWFILIIANPITSSMSKYYEQTKSNYSKDIDHLVTFNKNGLWIKENFDEMQRIISAEKPKNFNLINVSIFHLDNKSSLIEKIQAKSANIESKEWISAQTITSRRSWFNDYVYPIIGHLAILDITFNHAVKLLSQKTRKGQPHLWNDSNSQARKIRGYCEDIIDMGLIKLAKRDSHFNVFTYKNNLSRRFGKPSKIHEAESQPFLHYEHLPNFIAQLIRFQEQAPKGGRPEVDCFIFGMLACTRSNCTRIADWADIDLKKKVWTVPKEKVGKKTKKDWPIPLHPRAIEIIKAQPSAKRKEGRIFSSLKHAKLNDRSLTSLLKLFPDIKAYKEKPGDPDRFPVFHGMRTTMNGWAKANKYDFDTRDLMLQHLQESTTHAAYDRGNAMLEERREIVNGYEEYAFSMVTSNKVVPLKRKAS